ncbi:winged helix-turn-helix transcriptional regulator [Plantibacter sp. Mn2098]|uniref:winged helix-turn-helix transcriptional regulator n=1 Tax=Plantibacter sp. Mn2098 TaxID=3395266 RepID=UPI003BE6A752
MMPAHDETPRGRGRDGARRRPDDAQAARPEHPERPDRPQYLGRDRRQVDVERFLKDPRLGRRAPTDQERQALESVVADAVRSRDRRHLADLDVRRSIFELADGGVSQRDIANLVGISQPEVSRRLKRRALTPVDPSPRELIQRRSAGLLSTEAMMEALSTMILTSQPPTRAARFDPGATSTGSAKQIAASFQEGLLSKAEYEQLRGVVRAAREAGAGGAAIGRVPGPTGADPGGPAAPADPSDPSAPSDPSDPTAQPR